MQHLYIDVTQQRLYKSLIGQEFCFKRGCTVDGLPPLPGAPRLAARPSAAAQADPETAAQRAAIAGIMRACPRTRSSNAW